MVVNDGGNDSNGGGGETDTSRVGMGSVNRTHLFPHPMMTNLLGDD